MFRTVFCQVGRRDVTLEFDLEAVVSRVHCGVRFVEPPLPVQAEFVRQRAAVAADSAVIGPPPD